MTDIDCSRVKNLKAYDAYILKFESALKEHLSNFINVDYEFCFKHFSVRIIGLPHKIKVKKSYKEKYIISITIYEGDGYHVSFNPSSHMLFSKFEWADKFESQLLGMFHAATFCLENGNGPDILKFLFTVLRHVYKTDKFMAFS